MALTFITHVEKNPQEWYLQWFPSQKLGERSVPPTRAQVPLLGATACSHLERPCGLMWKMTTGDQFLVLGYICLREGKQPTVAPLSETREREQTFERCVAWRSPRAMVGELEEIATSDQSSCPG